MFEVGNIVTLKTAEQYDRKTMIDTEEMGDVIELAEADGGPQRYIVAMNDMVDEEGVTPLLWKTASELNLHQI